MAVCSGGGFVGLWELNLHEQGVSKVIVCTIVLHVHVCIKHCRPYDNLLALNLYPSLVYSNGILQYYEAHYCDVKPSLYIYTMSVVVVVNITSGYARTYTCSVFMCPPY